MASGFNYNPLSTIKTDAVLMTAKLTGTGAGTALVVADPTPANSEVVSVTFVSTGLHDIVFRRSFPQLLSLLTPGMLGTTAGLQCNWVSLDPVAKTARIRIAVAGAVTDAATTDTIYLNWVVRNSGKNS